jgi:Fic family protein
VAHLEAISTVRIDGQLPDLKTLFELGYALESQPEQQFAQLTFAKTDGEDDLLDSAPCPSPGLAPASIPCPSPTSTPASAPCPSPGLASEPEQKPEQDPIRLDSLASLRYKSALAWCAKNITPGCTISPEILLEIHSRCRFGVSYKESGATFRKAEFVSQGDVATQQYQPPEAQQLEMLIDDLCAFINQDSWSPISQSAIAHFQFESIKPFKTAMDRTGRAMCHAIFFRRGFMNGTITPIALLPTLSTKTQAHMLSSYDMGNNIDSYARRMGAINRWVSFCAVAADLAADSINMLSNMVRQLEAHWHQQTGKLNKGSIGEELLLLLPAHPILTVASAMALTDKSFSATNDALHRLTRAGVLTMSQKSHEKTRYFRAHEALEAFEKTLKRIVDKRAAARNSFLESYRSPGQR